MDFSFQRLLETLRIVVSVIPGLVALLPFWSKLDASKGERAALGISAAAIVFLLWPADYSYCRHIYGYIWATAGFLIWFFVAYALDVAITRQFSHSQPRRDDDRMDIITVLGGPKLAPAARALQVQNPHWSTQEIFERLDYDPLRTWERWPRTRLIVAHRFLALSKGLAPLLALVAALAFLVLFREVRQSHRALTLEPSEDQTVLAGRSIAITPTLHECCSDIKWDIDGLSTEKLSGALGEISNTGTYSAPARIEKDLDLYVVATPVQHTEERKKVKIQLRSHPDYSKPHYWGDFVIEVIDKHYSWIIGKNKLNGENGLAFAHRMASDGMFNGFQDIICIGAASREYKRSKSDEEQRAMDRANVLGRWVQDAVRPSDVRIHALKIGRYDEETKLTPEQTAPERQVVIIGILSGADENVDLLSALRKAFEEKRSEEPLLGMYLDKYPVENWKLQDLDRRKS